MPEDTTIPSESTVTPSASVVYVVSTILSNDDIVTVNYSDGSISKFSL